MSDFLCFMFATAIGYVFSLAGIEYANSKPQKTRIFIICVIVVVFSAFSGWTLTINQNRIPIDAVEKEWKRYTIFCKEEHVSWSDITFPEWLELEASEALEEFE